MLMHLCLLTLVLLGAVRGGYIPPAPKEIYHTQLIDHNRTFRGTFKQRVLVYDQYYLTSSIPAAQRPIFFTCGGEADVHGGYYHNGFLFEMGKPLGALLVFPEHRYYGQSMPFGNYSHTLSNVTLLTVQQALADFALNIDTIRTTYHVPSSAPLVAFGGSYPGELASYMRVAYPQRVDAALASSAPNGPLPAPQYGFFRVATADFALGHPQCPSIVRSAFVELQQLFAAGDMASVQRRLQLCQTGPSLQFLTFWIENAFATLGMEDYPYAVGDFDAYPAAEACRLAWVMYQASQDPVAGLAAALGVVYNATGSATCFDVDKEFAECADITGCGLGPDALSWDYQSCTQVVNEIGTNNVTDAFPPLPFPRQAINNYCLRRWHTSPDPYTLRRTYNYTTSTRIIFSSGALDPWSPYDVLRSPNPGQLVTLLMADAAHHLDLRGSDPADPPSVTQVRALEARILQGWMTQAYKERLHRHQQMQ